MKYVTTILLILSSCVVMAQEDSFSSQKDSVIEYNVFKEHVPYWRLEKAWKFSPFDLFSVVPTVSVDHEVKMTPELSFQFGVGVIPSFMQFSVGNDWGRFKSMNGYRVRFESRFWGFKNPHLYMASELSMRHLIIANEVTYGMEPDDFGNFAYFVTQDELFNRFTTQFNLKIGMQRLAGDKVLVDFYGGISFRRNNVDRISDPPELGTSQNLFWGNMLNWQLSDGFRSGFVTPVIGLKIGWLKPARADI
ncbi:hypothetical protein K6119_13360 [Paracrocinitomix mangrovi]|uniref:hypothetical protein n=1 Tax=Paracrocinitomix mangrovi TaxID=2862509 RepID=UPI001C8DFAD3|nr:hypothetical protein [Paracrocinitomix mangrovi]UKN00719.1 hypothetical protein K6119_13360 [Paracrocinitomix mangrovi]